MRFQPAESNAERITAVVCMVVGAIFFSYMVGSISAVATQLDPEATVQQRLFDTLRLFSRHSVVTPEFKSLKATIRGYITQCRCVLTTRFPSTTMLF